MKNERNAEPAGSLTVQLVIVLLSMLMLGGCVGGAPPVWEGIMIEPQSDTTMEYDLVGGGPTLIFHAYKLNANGNSARYTDRMNWYSTNEDVGYMDGNRFRATGHGTTEVWAHAYQFFGFDSNRVTVTVIAPKGD